MSSDLSQLMSQLLRIEHGQTPQILSISGSSNQTSHPDQGALSSDGPNASQRFQVANSNVYQVTYNFHLIGNSNLGSRAIANGDHQDSQSTVISYTRPSMIEAADQVDFNAKLSAVKESTVELGKSTAELRGSTLELAEATAKFSEWVTALNWPTSKLSLASGPAVAFGDLAVNYFMSGIKISRSIIEFGRLSVKFGESAVRDSDSILLAVSDTSALNFWETTTRYRESFTRYDESRTRYIESIVYLDSTEVDESAQALDESEASPLKELIDFNAIEEMGVELKTSSETVTQLLNAFSESVVAYNQSITTLLNYDFDAKLTAVKESTVEVRKSTAEVKGLTVKLAETTAELNEWITALDWPTFKLGLTSEPAVTLGDEIVEHSMLLLKLSLSVLEFSQSSVELGESTVRDSDSMTTVSESTWLVMLDALTLKLVEAEAAARFRQLRARLFESYTRYMESLAYINTTELKELDNSESPRLMELVKPVADLNTLEKRIFEVAEQIKTADTLLATFSESMMAYAKSFAAPDDLVAALSIEISNSDVQ